MHAIISRWRRRTGSRYPKTCTRPDMAAGHGGGAQNPLILLSHSVRLISDTLPNFQQLEWTMSWVQSRATEMMARHGFLGVPVESFEDAGRSQFIALLNEGLCPESKVLDIGCGCLRTTYWLTRFLDRGCYHGIEPARCRVEYGLHYLFTPGLMMEKQPRFDFNPHFDSSVFATKFDYFLAGSIWTHASKSQIETTLESFLRDSVPTGVFLASYLPAQHPGDDYQGDSWVGTSHESDTPGVIRHALSWITEQCQKRRLSVREVPGMAFDSQYWLRIGLR